MQNISELRQAFDIRAAGASLKVECTMDGIFNAHTAIIAEAPGEQEVKTKKPLIGASGSILWKHLQKYQLNRSNTYVTNVCKRRIAFETGKRAMNKHEQDFWFALLRWELSQLPNLKYLLLLGNVSLEAIVGKSGVSAWRGSVLEVELDGPEGKRVVKVVVANNPAMIIREPKLEVTFAFDMAKFNNVIQGKWKPHVITPIINPTYSDAMDFLGTIHKEADANPIAYDVEVISQETACVGFANSSHTGMCINFRDFSNNRYTEAEEISIRRKIQTLVCDPNVRLIAQNGMFDMTWLWYKDKIRVTRNWFDTMLAHHCLYPQLPHNLGFITTQYSNHPYYKDEKENWKEGGNIDEFWQYNVKDCCLTLHAAHRMNAELEQQGLANFFFSHIMRLQPHLARMTVGGVKMDMELKQKIRDELAEEVARKLQVFYNSIKEVTGLEDYEPNPSSPAQMSDLYFSKLKLVGRGTSTDEENRNRMYKHPRTSDGARSIIDAQNAYAKDKKFLSTYAEMRVDPDGRVRCEYKQTGVQSAPGRLSSAGVLWGSGMNLQNQPQRAYPMFITDDGYVFIYFDLSQAEARYVGWDAKIEKWIEQFERARLDGSYDAHRALASEMFNVPYDEVPTKDRNADGSVTIRFTAKRCRHGLNYRMAPDRLASTTGLPLAEAELAYRKYHRITPELKKWWDALEQEMRAEKCLYNSFGRRLKIMERITPESLESIVAFRPQSTIGDKVCQVIYQCESDDRWPMDARMAMNVHDALIAIAPVDKAKTCLSIMKKYAEEPILVRPDMPPMIIPAETKMSVPDEHGIHRWSTLKLCEVEAAA